MRASLGSFMRKARWCEWNASEEPSLNLGVLMQPHLCGGRRWCSLMSAGVPLQLQDGSSSHGTWPATRSMLSR